MDATDERLQVRVLLFGPPAMAAGVDSIQVVLQPATTCGQLKRAIAEQVPPLRKYAEAARFAVNGRYAEAELRIHADDEVAMICMVSGG